MKAMITTRGGDSSKVQAQAEACWLTSPAPASNQEMYC